MCSQLVVVLVVEALDGRVLDRAVHALDLAVGPRVVRLGQPVLDPVCLADHVEAHRPGVDGVPVAGLLGELDAPRHCLSDRWRSNGSIGQDRVDLVGHGFEHVLEELACSLSVIFFNELSNGELGRPVDADEQIELPFAGLHLCDIDVKEADRVALELLPLGLVTLDIRQPRDAMALKAAVQCRACQVRNRRLQGIEAVIKREQRMAPERYDRRLFGLGQDGGPRFRRPGLHVLDCRPLAPLRHRLGVDAQFPAQLRERSLPLSSL